MKMITIILILSLFACQGNENVSFSKENQEKIEKSLTDSLFQINDSIRYEDFYLKTVTSCENDSVVPDEKNLFNPIVLNQKFEFYEGNSKIKEIQFPIRIVKGKTFKGIKEYVDCVIFEIQLIKEKNGAFYYMSGYGGCNSDCPTFDAVLNLKGEIIALEYRTEKEILEKVGESNVITLYRERKYKGAIIENRRIYP
jgi:hypothetical protein